MPTGFVLINCESDHVGYVVNELKKINGVNEICDVFGIYNIVVKVKAEDKHIFTKIISSQIREITKLNSTLTLMVANNHGEFL